MKIGTKEAMQMAYNDLKNCDLATLKAFIKKSVGAVPYESVFVAIELYKTRLKLEGFDFLTRRHEIVDLLEAIKEITT